MTVLTMLMTAMATPIVNSASHRHIEPEHRDKKVVWRIARAYLTAHTKFGLKCSGSICLYDSLY